MPSSGIGLAELVLHDAPGTDALIAHLIAREPPIREAGEGHLRSKDRPLVVLLIRRDEGIAGDIKLTDEISDEQRIDSVRRLQQ